MLKQFTTQEIKQLNVKNVSTMIDILLGRSKQDYQQDYQLTHGLMAKYDSETRQALMAQGLGPVPDGTALDPNECEFGIEGLMVFLFEPQSLIYLPFDEEYMWMYVYQVDDNSPASGNIYDPDRFYREHLGISHQIASPSHEQYLDEYLDADITHKTQCIIHHWNRMRDALLSS